MARSIAFIILSLLVNMQAHAQSAQNTAQDLNPVTTTTSASGGPAPTTAATPPPKPNDFPPPPPPPPSSLFIRGVNRWQIHAIYSPLDLFVPGKKGVSSTYIRTPAKSYEFEYLRGKFGAPSFFDNLGNMTDEKISFMARNYFSGNSFNFSYGLTYFRFQIHLGSEYLQSLTNNEKARFDVVALESLGFNIGVGNRWALTDHMSFGVDWIELYQPLVETKNESGFVDKTNDPDKKDDVEDVLGFIGHFPRVAVLKLSLGATF